MHIDETAVLCRKAKNGYRGIKNSLYNIYILYF